MGVKQSILDGLKTAAKALEPIAIEDVGVIEKAGIIALQSLVNELVDKINKASGASTTTASE